ncbi:MAG: acetylornithine transaminase [Syntrophomonadaceae bacterium]|nr:acetylornithine transaminase [Syntrophomonadaceae bacterium]
MTNLDSIYKAENYVLSTYNRFPISLVKGEGSYVWDADGKEYVDFVSGIAVCALGHSNPSLVKAITEQAQQLWHISNLYYNEPQVLLAEKLISLTGLGKVFFCNSGAEANEAAIKLVRKYFYRHNEAGRNEIISFNKSFHGRTMGALAATGQAKYHEGFAPMVAGFAYADYNDLSSVEKLISDKLCAIIVEPIQGEGGINLAELGFIRGLRDICTREGIWLIFDEVQTGVGRTGKLWAYEHYGLKPDIITMAKALGGGFPIGAMVVADKVASGFAPGDHATTYGGNPLACAVASAVLDIVGETEFLDKVKARGDYLVQSLKDIGDSRIRDIRGQGLLIGVEFSEEVGDLIKLCVDKGLLLVGAGPNVVRFIPPLNVKEVEINKAIAIFKDALKAWQSN